MIKNITNQESLQEAMGIKMVQDRFADVAECTEYEIGLESAYGYNAEIENNYNAIMEQVGIAEMRYYGTFGKLLSYSEANDLVPSNGNHVGVKRANNNITARSNGDVDRAGKSNSNSYGSSSSSSYSSSKRIGSSGSKPIGIGMKSNDDDDNVIDVEAKEVESKKSAKEIFDKYVKKAIALLQRARDIIASIVKKAMSKLREFDGGNKAFLKMYGKKLDASASKPVDLDKGYAFANLKNSETIKKNIADAAKNVNPYTPEEYKKFIYGETVKVSSTLGEQRDIIKNTSTNIKNINAIWSAADNSLNEHIKKFKQTKSKDEIDKMMPVARNISKSIQTICSILCKAYVDLGRQAKAMCIKGLGKKGESSEKAELVPANASAIMYKGTSINEILAAEF